MHGFSGHCSAAAVTTSRWLPEAPVPADSGWTQRRPRTPAAQQQVKRDNGSTRSSIAKPIARWRNRSDRRRETLKSAWAFEAGREIRNRCADCHQGQRRGNRRIDRPNTSQQSDPVRHGRSACKPGGVHTSADQFDFFWVSPRIRTARTPSDVESGRFLRGRLLLVCAR